MICGIVGKGEGRGLVKEAVAVVEPCLLLELLPVK
jgi:hypothetical protein